MFLTSVTEMYKAYGNRDVGLYDYNYSQARRSGDRLAALFRDRDAQIAKLRQS